MDAESTGNAVAFHPCYGCRPYGKISFCACVQALSIIFTANRLS